MFLLRCGSILPLGPFGRAKLDIVFFKFGALAGYKETIHNSAQYIDIIAEMYKPYNHHMTDA